MAKERVLKTASVTQLIQKCIPNNFMDKANTLPQGKPNAQRMSLKAIVLLGLFDNFVVEVICDPIWGGENVPNVVNDSEGHPIISGDLEHRVVPATNDYLKKALAFVCS